MRREDTGGSPLTPALDCQSQELDAVRFEIMPGASAPGFFIVRSNWGCIPPGCNTRCTAKLLAVNGHGKAKNHDCLVFIHRHL
jgi:hypothetical protein